MVVKEVAAKKPASSLPEGWRVVRFGDVVRNVDMAERKPLENGLERYVGLDHLDPESLHIKRWGLIEEGTSFTRKFVEGQVLFGKRRAYQRKAAVAEFDGICSGDILVFEPNGDDLIPDLLPFIVQSDKFFEHALSTSAGSLSPRTKWKDLSSYEFALPPKDEQHRIADILWATDSESRALLHVLEALQELIVAASNEVFAKADSDKISLGELLAKNELDFQTGPFGTVLKASSYVDEGTPIVNPVNMRDGKLVTDDGPFLSASECERLSRFKLKRGDVILGRKGDVGRAIYITDEYKGYILGSDCIRVRLNTNQIGDKFFYYFFTSPPTRRFISRLAFGTTMPGINEGLLSRIEISIPSERIQAKIVMMFERFDSSIETIQSKLDSNSSLAKALINQLIDTPFEKGTH